MVKKTEAKHEAAAKTERGDIQEAEKLKVQYEKMIGQKQEVK
jgi:hypothetical protein